MIPGMCFFSHKTDIFLLLHGVVLTGRTRLHMLDVFFFEAGVYQNVISASDDVIEEDLFDEKGKADLQGFLNNKGLDWRSLW